MKLALGFLFLGLLVGDMAGLTSESLVSKLIALLFALFGGSIVLLFQKFSPDERNQVGVLLLSISIGMILGVHAGIVTTQYRLLSPRPSVNQAGKSTATAPAPNNQTSETAKQAPPPPKPPIAPQAAKSEPCPDVPAYLKGHYSSGLANIDSRYNAGVISGAEAYSELKLLIEGKK